MGVLRLGVACAVVAACADANGTVTLTETTSTALTFGTTVACSDTGSGNTRDNTWYRAYALADYAGVVGAFHVTRVSFAVQEASASMPVEVVVGTYAGALDTDTLDMSLVAPLVAATVTPPDTTGHTGEIVDVSIDADIPAGGTFVVSIAEPDMDNAGGLMYIGATTSGETHRGYISSTICNAPTPETTVQAGGTGQIIIDVAGLH